MFARVPATHRHPERLSQLIGEFYFKDTPAAVALAPSNGMEIELRERVEELRGQAPQTRRAATSRCRWRSALQAGNRCLPRLRWSSRRPKTPVAADQTGSATVPAPAGPAEKAPVDVGQASARNAASN